MAALGWGAEVGDRRRGGWGWRSGFGAVLRGVGECGFVSGGPIAVVRGVGTSLLVGVGVVAVVGVGVGVGVGLVAVVGAVGLAAAHLRGGLLIVIAGLAVSLLVGGGLVGVGLLAVIAGFVVGHAHAVLRVFGEEGVQVGA